MPGSQRTHGPRHLAAPGGPERPGQSGSTASPPVPRHPARGVLGLLRVTPGGLTFQVLSPFHMFRGPKLTHRCGNRPLRGGMAPPTRQSSCPVTRGERAGTTRLGPPSRALRSAPRRATAPTGRVSPDRSRSERHRISDAAAPAVPTLERPRARPRMGRGHMTIVRTRNNVNRPPKHFL